MKIEGEDYQYLHLQITLYTRIQISNVNELHIVSRIQQGRQWDLVLKHSDSFH